jgi:hypothetical protein
VFLNSGWTYVSAATLASRQLCKDLSPFATKNFACNDRQMVHYFTLHYVAIAGCFLTFGRMIGDQKLAFVILGSAWPAAKHYYPLGEGTDVMDCSKVSRFRLLFFPKREDFACCACVFHAGKYQFSRSIILYVLQRGPNSFTNWLGPAQLRKELKANTELITSSTSVTRSAWRCGWPSSCSK